jgi:hypothetical protein
MTDEDGHVTLRSHHGKFLCVEVLPLNAKWSRCWGQILLSSSVFACFFVLALRQGGGRQSRCG